MLAACLLLTSKLMVDQTVGLTMLSWISGETLLRRLEVVRHESSEATLSVGSAYMY